jgi:5S rRNA maturation endonuclease (ribonuclease M5)
MGGLVVNTSRLIAVLEDHNFKVSLVEGGTELVIACPLCFSEKSKLYISAATAAWICFRCNSRGGLHSLLLEVCELPPNEAYPMEMALLEGKQQRPALIVSRPAPASTIELPPGFMPDRGDGLAACYLQHRCLDGDWAPELGIGYCLVGYYHHRVIVPVVTQGSLRTFVARTWLEDEPKKVLMPPGSQAERALFGYDQLAGEERAYWKDLILVEGVFDALRLWQAGYRETVATLGAHVTELQRNLVKRLAPGSVVLLRDADDAGAGRESAIKDAKALSEAMLNVSIANLPDGTDPGSASPAEIRRALDEAKPVELQLGIEALKEAHHGR